MVTEVERIKTKLKNKTVFFNIYLFFWSYHTLVFLYKQDYISPPQFSSYCDMAALVSDSRDDGTAKQKERREGRKSEQRKFKQTMSGHSAGHRSLSVTHSLSLFSYTHTHTHTNTQPSHWTRESI